MVKFIFQQTEPILDEDVLGCLNNLHEKFVLVPFGKASNDVAIIFLKIYLQKKYLMKLAYMVITPLISPFKQTC